MIKTEVLIVGGGVPGLTLALMLGQKGVDVCIVDTEKPIALKDTPVTGRTVALWTNAVEILKSAGVWENIAPFTQTIDTLKIIDDSAKNLEPASLVFQAQDIGEYSFGENTPNLKLRACLVEAIADISSITHIKQAKLHDYRIERNKVMARLDNGQDITALLIVGADGRRSTTRAIAGIDYAEHDYKQSAITCIINHSKPHENTSIEHHRPGGPFTTVPMPDLDKQHRSAIVWMESHEDADHFMRLDKSAFEATLQDRTKGALGHVTLANAPESWPIITQHAKSFVAERCALMAEAAHVMSPLGAQGLNLSLRDVKALYDCVIQAMQVGEDPGSAKILAPYNANRKGDVLTRVYGIDALNRLVANDKSSVRAVRRMGIKTLNAIPVLKDAVLQQGLSIPLRQNTG